jgi:hypothetical protein
MIPKFATFGHTKQPQGPQMTTPLTQLRETTGTILATWAVRVGLVGAILFGLQSYFGAIHFLWWAWPMYAVISLVFAVILARMKNAQIDRVEAELASGK